MGKITAFIDKYLIVGLAGVIAILSIAFGVTYYRMSSAQSDLKEAQTEIIRLGDDIATKETQLLLKDSTIATLETRAAQRLREQQTHLFDLQGVLNAPAEENVNAVDDVLCRAVSGAKCLRND